MSSKYFVTGIGSAIIDVLALVEDDFLENNRLVKGSMTLLEQKGVSKLVNLKYDKISSGGSVANTIVAISNFGIKN
jgi:sugar/nucleoside kinase (ribokinase family)